MENRKNLSQKPYLTGGRLGARIILDSSGLKGLINPNVVRKDYDVIEYEVPFKSGNKRVNIINWASCLYASFTSNYLDLESGVVYHEKAIEDYLNNIEEFLKRNLSDDPAIAIKYENTAKYLKYWIAIYKEAIGLRINSY